MKKPTRSQGILLAYGSSMAILSVLVLSEIFLSPSEPGNVAFFGLSLSRLVLVFGLLSVLVFFVILTFKAFKNSLWAQAFVERWFEGGTLSQRLAWFALLSLGLGWVGYFIPVYRLGILTAHEMRIRPVIILILLASLATLAVMVVIRGRFKVPGIKTSKTLLLTLILFTGYIIVQGLTFYSGFGQRASEDFWYGAGVPILTSQLIIAILSSILFLQLEKKWKSKHSDLIITLLIFVVTAILWAAEPLQKSFLLIGPYPPNHVLYPFVDAALFDMASQFALIGQGILNGLPYDRGLYISFLVYLHSILGQNYEQIMAVQAGLFAIFPALIYLIGRSLNIRMVAFAVAIVATLRGLNSIAASNMIDLASPKMPLTDFPSAIGVALVILLTCEWLKKPHEKWHHALMIGGVLGLALMLRTNTLLLLLFIPLYSFLAFSPHWKKWLISCSLLMVAMFAVTFPWELRNNSHGANMYQFIFARIQAVIRERYIPVPAPKTFLPPDQKLEPIILANTRILLELYPATELAQNSNACKTTLCFVSKHFLHNISMSFLTLPTSPVLDDLRHTVKDAQPYWRPDWDGSLTPSSLGFLVLNTFFITLGISLAWNQLRLVGLTPLAVFVFYNISNALARTSGGRYLVPMDWIISIYFLLGVFWLIIWFANAIGIKWELFSIPTQQDIPQQMPSRNAWSTIAILAALFGLGSLIPLSENLHPPRYQNVDMKQTLIDHEQEIATAGISTADIDLFLKSSNAELLVGRILYPRYYPMDRGEILFDPFVTMGFPRTAFTLIGPQGQRGVILPGPSPDHFPHAVDAIVLGCREEKYLDALAVILLDENGSIYTRSPESEFQCPLKQPVCNNNRVCH